MNIFSTMLINAGDWMAARLSPYINDALELRYSILGNYYSGDHRRQLKVQQGQPDDNVQQNFTGLGIDRSVSRLFRGGIQFNLPEGATKQQEYIDKIWDLNRKEILLFQIGLHGAVYGTPYLKICPDELIDPFTGDLYPRLVALDPELVRVHTDPQDKSKVLLYQIGWKIGERAFTEITYRSDITFTFKEREAVPIQKTVQYGDDEALENAQSEKTWIVEEWEQSLSYGNILTMTSRTSWSYNFPPILHWKNLPSLKSCYGKDDMSDAINIQDKNNFVVSNTGKIIKFHAHPETIVTGVNAAKLKEGRLDAKVGSTTAIENEAAKAYNLEMNSDLASSRLFALDMRQSIFDIAREVDISSLSDKMGALTNFGLHVLYTDALDKNDTKRQLYGDALKELNRRLLVLNNWMGEQSDPGKITWGEALITNIIEEMAADEKAQNNGWIDKETIIKRYVQRYGVSAEDVIVALDKQSQKDNQDNANIGAEILRRFGKGEGVEMPKQLPNQKSGGMIANIPQAERQKAK